MDGFEIRRLLCVLPEFYLQNWQKRVKRVNSKRVKVCRNPSEDK